MTTFIHLLTGSLSLLGHSGTRQSLQAQTAYVDQPNSSCHSAAFWVLGIKDSILSAQPMLGSGTVGRWLHGGNVLTCPDHFHSFASHHPAIHSHSHR